MNKKAKWKLSFHVFLVTYVDKWLSMRTIETLDELLALPGKNIAFFGGSFDPPHFGHLDFIKKAISIKDLDYVIVCPHSLNPNKNVEQIQHRLRMMDLLFETAHSKKIVILSPEVCHGIQNPIFIDDIFYLLKRKKKEVFVLIGCDSLEHCAQLFKSVDVTFIIGCRINRSEAEKQLVSKNLNCLFIDDIIPCSSSKLKENRETRNSYLSQQVKEYIEDHQLYWSNPHCQNWN
ncbi:MAG: adenylyltransferase/cytidyltransferase family protein [Salinivirgaceae bacterium]